jgi:hypothetical protein
MQNVVCGQEMPVGIPTGTASVTGALQLNAPVIVADAPDVRAATNVDASNIGRCHSPICASRTMIASISGVG